MKKGEFIMKTLARYFLFNLILLSFALISHISGMDPVVKEKKRESVPAAVVHKVLPQKRFAAFDLKRSCEKSQPWVDVTPKNILITENGVLLAKKRGVVEYLAFVSMAGLPKPVIELPKVKTAPLIAAAQKADDLLMVGAGNYKNADNKLVAQYVVCFQKTGLSKSYQLNASIQAIACSNQGDLLAIGMRDERPTLSVHDIENNIKNGVWLTGDSWCVDVIFNRQASQAIVGLSDDTIHLFSINRAANYIGLSHLQRVSTKDDIAQDHLLKINYVGSPETSIIYTTLHGDAKEVDLYDLVENETLAGRQVGPVKSNFFLRSGCLNLIVPSQDTQDQPLIAMWTRCITDVEEVGKRNRVTEILRKNREMVEKFVLCLPENAVTHYEYIKEDYRTAVGINYLVIVALRNNKVVAFAADGTLYLWKLPDFKDANLQKGSLSSEPNAHRMPAYSEEELEIKPTKSTSGEIKSKSNRLSSPSSKRIRNPESPHRIRRMAIALSDTPVPAEENKGKKRRSPQRPTLAHTEEDEVEGEKKELDSPRKNMSSRKEATYKKDVPAKIGRNSVSAETLKKTEGIVKASPRKATTLEMAAATPREERARKDSEAHRSNRAITEAYENYTKALKADMYADSDRTDADKKEKD
jgi:hypothetical protein